jgi:hypothetical protein
MALRFKRHGRNVSVKEGGLVVEKTYYEPGHGMAFTNRCLRTSEMFEVDIMNLKLPELSLGIAKGRPQEVVPPKYMFASLATLILFCSLGSGGNVRGNNTVQKALSRDEVKALKEGDKLGLMMTPEGQVAFFLNERQICSAQVTTTEAVYGFIELFGWNGDCVRLLPDLREEQQHLAACDRVTQENKTQSLTVMQGLLNGLPREGKSTPAMTLKFDHRCGRSVEVSEGGLVVEARNNW